MQFWLVQIKLRDIGMLEDPIFSRMRGKGVHSSCVESIELSPWKLDCDRVECRVGNIMNDELKSPSPFFL